MILKKRQADFRLPLDKYLLVCYNNTVHSRGVAQLVARDVWDVDAAGSNPVTPTKLVLYAQKISPFHKIRTDFFVYYLQLALVPKDHSF